jgi:undecaprenyl-diphosphatase
MPRRRPVIAATLAILLMVALGVALAVRASPFEFETEWMEEIIEHRSPFWLVPSLVMNFLGGGWFAIFIVPLGVAAVLFAVRRPRDAVFFLVASALSAGLVQLFKAVFGRARPEDVLVHVDPGSFPSGHVANAATVAVALGLILQRVWVWAAGAVYVVLMALSRTYLGAHWITDTIGGALLGAGVAFGVWALLHAVWRDRSPQPR